MARQDILETLAKSVWVQEAARRDLYREWGEAFAEREGIAAARAQLAADWLGRRGVPVPDAVLPMHMRWWRSMAGERPDARAGGAAFADWARGWIDMYVGDRLDIDLAALAPSQELPAIVDTAPAESFEIILDRVALGDRERPLERASAPCFVMFNDVHVGEPGAAEAARQAVADVNVIGPEFVVVVGDITAGAEPETFRAAREILDGLEMPYYAVMGNHEVVQQSTLLLNGDEQFEAAFGYRSTSRLLDCGGLQLGLLDSTDRTAWDFPMPTRPGGRGSVGVIHGAIRDEDIDMLVSEVDPSRPLMLAAHHQFHPFVGFPAILGGVMAADSDRLLGALKGKDLRGILAGHTHRCALTRVGDGIAQLELPATGKWPYGFGVVSATERGPEVVVRQISDHDLIRDITPTEGQSSHWAFGPESTLRHLFGRFDA